MDPHLTVALTKYRFLTLRRIVNDRFITQTTADSISVTIATVCRSGLLSSRAGRDVDHQNCWRQGEPSCLHSFDFKVDLPLPGLKEKGDSSTCHQYTQARRLQIWREITVKSGILTTFVAGLKMRQLDR